MRTILTVFGFLLAASIGDAVEGQIFIVTKGGQNIKLGLVKVGIYQRADVEAYIAQRKRVVIPQDRELTRQSERLSDAHRYDESNVAIKKSLLLFYTFFDGLHQDKALVTAKSDADGKFSINVPSRSDILLVARSSRLIGNETEYYTWLLPPEEWESPLFLSNDNTFSIILREKPQMITGRKDVYEKEIRQK